MKEFGLKLSLLVAAAALAGCADGATESSNPSECTESVCANATTLNNCVYGVVVPQTCDFGCVGNACVQNGPGPNTAACTGSTCKDDKTLYLCINGSQSEVPCANGCANGQCLPKGGNVNPPQGGCVASICKDANVLLACMNGAQQEVPCPYGCDNGACKTACTANVCKDAGTLLVCQNGVSIEQPCASGCENGACKVMCTADFCSTDKVLVVCGTDGNSQSVECPYGCANGKCNTIGGSCTDGVRQCNGRDVEICEGGAWKTFEACANGCENNACKPSAGSCTDGSMQCNGNNVEVCENSAWKVSETCANGCENNACKPSTGSCTDGVKQCNGNNLEVCENSAWKVSETCANGCENNACKAAPVNVDWCDFFDCTSEYGSQCSTDHAICNAKNAFCVNRDAAGDSKCGNGETSWSDTSGSYCLLVGSDAACLDVAWDCSAEKLQSGGTVGDACKADNASFLASCTAYGYGCGPACSTIGEKGTVCNDFGDDGFYSHPAVCTQVGSNKILVDSSTGSSDYTECPKGCNADGTGCAGGTAPACTNGATQCSGNFVQTCTSGNWVNASSPCPNGCENGACKPNSGTCTNGATQCNGNFVQTCTSGNWVNASSPCPNGCENGACKPNSGTCSNGAKQCNGNYVQTCVSGSWVNASSACPNGCEAGECKSAPSCSNGAKQCNGNYVQTCVSGSWVNASSACANGCENGACKEAPSTVNWCDFYDCTSEFGSQCSTDHAICNTKNAFCVNRNAAGDSKCGNGETSWSDTSGSYCLLVGSDAACLDVAWDCSAEKLQSGGTVGDACKADNASFLASCTAGGYGCGPACSTIGEKGTVCNDFGDEGFYSHPAVCTQVGSNKILVDSSTSANDYTSCANGCNAAGTGCASATPSCSDGAKQCKGDYVQTCVSGSWQTASTACPNGCEAGACKPDSGVTECDMYDCSSEYLELCKGSFADTDIAICDATRPYCMKNASASCGAGQSALSQLYIDDDDNTQVSSPYCLVIGSDDSCLPGAYWDCGAESCKSDGTTCDTVCKAENSSFQAYCFEANGQPYVGCGLSCSKEGAKTQLCGTDSDGSYTYPAVCTKVGSKLIYVDAATSGSDYVDCSSTCNAAGTGCK